MFIIFFFSDPASTETYTLSLHDALPIWQGERLRIGELALLGNAQICMPCPISAKLCGTRLPKGTIDDRPFEVRDRKSTRLNSSHVEISYAVFCLKKKRHENLYGEDDFSW